jgi:hypothetical protein
MQKITHPIAAFFQTVVLLNVVAHNLVSVLRLSVEELGVRQHEVVLWRVCVSV